MRRIAWVMMVVGVVLLTLAPVALGEVAASYADSFDAPSYTGSNGSLHWKAPWNEVGESDGPGAGAVTVVPDARCQAGNCLRITSGLGSQAGAARFADLSIFATAELTFESASRTLGLPLIGSLTGDLVVQVTTNSGGSWAELYRADLAGLLGGNESLSLDDYLKAGFGVRFLAQNLLGGEVMVDDVRIAGELRPSPTTTTTTTVPTTTSPSTVPTTNTPTTLPETDPTPTTTFPDFGTEPTAPTTTLPRSDGRVPGRETTTTSTTQPVSPPVADPPAGGGSPPGEADTGMRMAAGGMQVDSRGLSFRPIGLAAAHKSSVERITSEWLSLAGLALTITGASALGVDRRRRNAIPAEPFEGN